MAEIPINKAADLRQWLHENQEKSWTPAQVNARFEIDLSARQLYRIFTGDFIINLPKFSFYRAPVRNTNPSKEITIVQLFQAITGTYYRQVTEIFRAMPAGREKAEFKTSRFDHVTFAGTFTTRKTDALKQASGYVILDYDHVPNFEKLKKMLINDPILSPELVFTSPSGDGLKVVVFNSDGADHYVFYQALTNYLISQYPDFAQCLDKKTKDIARACFVCYDENCYIKPQYLTICQALQN